MNGKKKARGREPIPTSTGEGAKSKGKGYMPFGKTWIPTIVRPTSTREKERPGEVRIVPTGGEAASHNIAVSVGKKEEQLLSRS